jgi:hypothetical protein
MNPTPREALRLRVDRVLFDRELLRTIMGIEVAIGGILFYVGLLILMVIGKLGAGLAIVALGCVVAFLGAMPGLMPEWLERLGFPNPLTDRRLRD